MKPWIKAAISVGLLALLFGLLPWAQVRDALFRLPPRVWAGVLVGFVVGHATGIIKWRLFVNAAKAGLGVVDATMAYCAGLFANLCLPSIVGGDVLRIAIVTRGCMVMMLARLPCNVDTSRQDQRSAGRGEWAQWLIPHQRPDGDRHQWLGERQHGASRCANAG